MTVKVTKPALNLREELSSLKKPSGVAGEAMLRAETPQEQQELLGVGRKNAIINGQYDIWQRGTTVTAGTGSAYFADRWTGYSGATGREYSQDLTECLKIGFRSGAKLVAGGGSGPSYYQKIEDVRTFAGKTVTLSFWLKADQNHTPNWQKLQQQFGSGGSAGVDIPVGNLGEVTTEWKKFVVTVNLPSVEGKTIGSNNLLLVYPFLLTGGRTYWTTGWQLELGSVATPFEHRSYGEELALCQRYYHQINYASTGRDICNGAAYNSSYVYGVYQYPVPMRTAPTMSSNTTAFTLNGNASGPTSTAITIEEVGNYSCQIKFTVAVTQGYAYWAKMKLSTDYIAFDAEL
jgi:hypothetical protein